VAISRCESPSRPARVMACSYPVSASRLRLAARGYLPEDVWAEGLAGALLGLVFSVGDRAQRRRRWRSRRWRPPATRCPAGSTADRSWPACARRRSWAAAAIASSSGERPTVGGVVRCHAGSCRSWLPAHDRIRPGRHRSRARAHWTVRCHAGSCRSWLPAHDRIRPGRHRSRARAHWTAPSQTRHPPPFPPPMEFPRLASRLVSRGGRGRPGRWCAVDRLVVGRRSNDSPGLRPRPARTGRPQHRQPSPSIHRASWPRNRASDIALYGASRNPISPDFHRHPSRTPQLAPALRQRPEPCGSTATLLR
jgi:hypothetical protein